MVKSVWTPKTLRGLQRKLTATLTGSCDQWAFLTSAAWWQDSLPQSLSAGREGDATTPGNQPLAQAVTKLASQLRAKSKCMRNIYVGHDIFLRLSALQTMGTRRAAHL